MIVYQEKISDFETLFENSKSVITINGKNLRYFVIEINKVENHVSTDMKCFCGMIDQRKVFSLISTIVNLRHAASRIRTCAEPEFRLY